MKRVSVIECYKKVETKSRALVIPVDEKGREKARRALYEKYYAFYTNTEDENLARMVTSSVEMGEQACLLYEEHAVSGDSLSGDDLEAIFEREIIPGYVSIKKLIKRQIMDCRHILRFRSVLCRDTLVPVICVRYYLVWPKRETLFAG